MPLQPPAVAETHSAPIEPSSGQPPKPFVDPAEQVLAAARTRSADRKARWKNPVTVSTLPTRRLPATTPPTRGRVLKCRVCGKAEPRSAGDLKRLARGAWPMCCGQVMPPVVETAGEPGAAESVEDDLPWADRRVADRRPARVGSRVEVRRGLLGMSPDVALKLIDVSEGGAQVRVKCALRPGEQVEVALWPPSDVQSVRGPAVVCWCLPTPTGEFRAGLRLRRKLIAEVVDLLAE